MGGTETARDIRRLSPATKIAFLTMHESETVVELARLAGADTHMTTTTMSLVYAERNKGS